jgi:hypothetical protein
VDGVILRLSQPPETIDDSVGLAEQFHRLVIATAPGACGTFRLDVGSPRKQSLAAVGLSFPVFCFIDFALGIQTFGVAIDR